MCHRLARALLPPPVLDQVAAMARLCSGFSTVGGSRRWPDLRSLGKWRGGGGGGLAVSHSAPLSGPPLGCRYHRAAARPRLTLKSHLRGAAGSITRHCTAVSTDHICGVACVCRISLPLFVSSWLHPALGTCSSANAAPVGVLLPLLHVKYIVRGGETPARRGADCHHCVCRGSPERPCD